MLFIVFRKAYNLDPILMELKQLRNIRSVFEVVFRDYHSACLVEFCFYVFRVKFCICFSFRYEGGGPIGEAFGSFYGSRC